MKLPDKIVVKESNLGRRNAEQPRYSETVIEPLAEVLAGLKTQRRAKGAGERGLAFRHPRSLDLSVEKSGKIERVPLHQDKTRQRIAAPKCQFVTSLKRAPARELKERDGLRVRKSRIDEIDVPELVRPHMPFALQVVTDDVMPSMILRSPRARTR